MASGRPLPADPRADSPIGPALRHIDAHLGEPLTLADLAAVSGLSPFHFARLFTALTGVSPIAYVRRARLMAAARRLADEPGARLIDLAFDCGFESQEAFTRAFVRAFGIPPGRFRRAHLVLQTMGVVAMDHDPIDLDATLLTQKELVRRPAFRVAGLRGTFDTETRHEIPLLWEKLAPRLPLPGQAGGEAYGICWSTGPEEPFRYMAAVALADGAAVPEGLEEFEVPTQTYLVFRQAVAPGPFHPQVAAAMGEIWGRRIPASPHRPSGGPDFELYPEDLRPGVTAGWMAYWVPVEA